MNKFSKDYYSILGVDKDASQKEIRKSYRALAMMHHPDRNPGNKKSEEMFKKVAEAYEVLSDTNKREQYDRGGEIGDLFVNPQDIFASFFRDRDFSFSPFSFNDQSSQSFRRQHIEPDTKNVYRANLKDIITGAKVDINLKHQKTCNQCLGLGHKDNKEKCKACNGQGMKTKVSGNMMFSSTCNVCFGSGRKIDNCLSCKGTGHHVISEQISLTIPAGINPLTTLRLQGKGNEVLIDSQVIIGDAYIIIDYPNKHKGIVVENGNIYTSIVVPFTTILNEEIIKVNILECKEIEFKLDSSKASGHQYRIEKQGIKDNNFCVVKVFIDFPKNKINEENRKKLIKLMREIYGEPPVKFEPNCTDNNS